MMMSSETIGFEIDLSDGYAEVSYLDLMRRHNNLFGVEATPGANLRLQDMIDRGAGYDKKDPFIDDSEAYDEMIPNDTSATYRGFYMNHSTLEYKDCDLPSPAPPKKKRKALTQKPPSEKQQ